MSMAAIRVQMSLPVSFRQDGEWITASCDVLDVVSQGRTQAEAKKNIVEALQLFVETCFEMGTLGAVLRQSGFTPQPISDYREDDDSYVEVPFSLMTARNAEAHAH